jgi:hypothetical protein
MVHGSPATFLPPIFVVVIPHNVTKCTTEAR